MQKNREKIYPGYTAPKRPQASLLQSTGLLVD